MKHTRLQHHIRYVDGSLKTVCVTAVLTAIGVRNEAFRKTWNGKRDVWTDVLRRNGYGVRSRKSKLPKECTVGVARRYIRTFKGDPKGAKYIVRVSGHIMLLDAQGYTVVDTDPRMRDRRLVEKIYMVFDKGGSWPQ